MLPEPQIFDRDALVRRRTRGEAIALEVEMLAYSQTPDAPNAKAFRMYTGGDDPLSVLRL